MSKVKHYPHESGIYHVSGEAIYIDDIDFNKNLLTGRVVYSPHSKAEITDFDLEEARKVEGVKAIISSKDLPAENQMGPIFHDEKILAEDLVECIGQAVFLIAAETEQAAIEAEKKIKISYKPLKPILTIREAIKEGELLQPARKIECGNVEKALKESDHIIEDELEIGGQEHWYLETQISVCVPGEGNEMKVYSSTQNPSEIQSIVAEGLGVTKMDIEVETRRMGGGFGGKESEANHIAVWAAILAVKTGQPVKLRLFRDDDQKITGKRHPFLLQYKVGFDKNGRINAIDLVQQCNGGYATDLTMSILERAMMHADNSYFIPNMRIIGNAWKLNLPSNTAYRGFGGPQGMASMEQIIDQIARFLKKDSAEIRYLNFYGMNDRNLTPYGQVVENNRLYMLWDQIIEKSDYKNRRKSVEKFNSENKYKKRGLALTPIKFGISFTTSFLNQAGALVNIYKDGSVLVNHGGTEMGQGLYTKIAIIASKELGVDMEKIKVNATNTSRVPNTSPTAASSGTDMNGMAVKNAIEKLKGRISTEITSFFNENEKKTKVEDIEFKDNMVFDKKNPLRKISFDEAVFKTYFNRVSLSATGFYKTPGVHFDRQTGQGHPYYYFAFGMAVTEVEVDILTGFYRNLYTEIIHDVGESINPRIDIGQIEGAFVQGTGWVTSEEMKYDKNGNLLNHSPDTYKIPGVRDIAEEFNVSLLNGAPNPNTIRRSKAVGEPPFMLSFSVWLAIKDAISAVGNHLSEPEYRLPATNEVIIKAVEKLRK